MSVLKSKQSGSVTLINLSVTATVNSYSIANSVLVFSYKGGSTSPQHGFVRGEKTNTTTLTFYRGNSGGTSCTIQWELLEYDSDTDVQDISESGTGTQNTTITAVDLSKAFVVPLGLVQSTDSTITSTCTAALQLTTTTNVQRRAGSTGSSSTFGYQVVEQGGTHGVNSVQYFSRSADTGTSFNQTITSVTTTRTVLYGSGKSNTSPFGLGQPFRMKLTSSTNVQGNRSGTASWDSSFYVVEYKDNVKVQAGTQAFGSSTIEQNVTLTSAKIANAAFQAGAALATGFAFGTHSYSAEGSLENTNIKGVITTATNLQLQRTGTYSTPTVDWQVMEADPDAVSIVQVNDTPSTATGTDGVSYSHTIGGNSNRILIVCVTTRGNSAADTAVSCTYNSVSMTQGATKVSSTGGFNVRSTIFYLLEASLPSAGSYTVAVTTPTGTSQTTESVAFSVREAAQQAPEATATAGADASANFVDTDITTVTADAFLIDCFAGDGYQLDSATTPRTGQTERATIPNSTTLSASTRPSGLAESWPMAWDFGAAYNRWAHSIIALKAAPQGVVQSCSGTSAGTSSVGATLSLPVRMDAQSDGVAAVAGELPVQKPLEGQSDGVATVTATIQRPVQLAGQSDGVATVTGGPLMLYQRLQGQSDGVATVTGTLQAYFSGISAGTSQVSAFLQVLHLLVGEADGASAVSGTMHQHHTFTGQSDGVATVQGNLTILSEIIPLEGRSDGASVVVADYSLLEVFRPLLAGVPGQATVTGHLASDRVLVGQADGVSTVGATLHVIRDLVGAADGASTVAGNLPVLTELVASAAGFSQVQGSLYGAVAPFHGSSAGQATVTGALEVAKALTSAVAGVATVSGTLPVLTAVEALSTGLATVTATLHRYRYQAGQADGVASVAGTLLVLRGVEAAIAAAADVTGAVDVRKALRVAVAGVATVSAMLEAQTPINGSSDGVALVQGMLNVLKALEGAADGASTVQDATLGKLIPLAAQADGVATVAADMLNIVWHVGQADGVSDVVGALDVLTALEAAIAGSTTPTAALSVAVDLVAASLGLAAPSGSLSITGLGLGPASARGRARVSGSLTVIRFISSYAGKDDPSIITRTV